MSAWLEMREVRKSFPGAQVLRGVHLRLQRGEVLALLGENGAGKSTLMKILGGILRPDSGEILLEGAPLEIESVDDAREAGIALIHQELALADNLDVTANFFLGRELRRGLLLDEAGMERECSRWLARVGARFPARARVSTLSVGEQQLVEIAKALGQNARVLIMDEPTSSLSLAESEHLFALVGELRAKGVSIIYISHRLGEVTRLADRALVLRDGQVSGELARFELEHDRMVSLMVGREYQSSEQRRSHARAESALRIRGLVVRAHPEAKLDLEVRRGEIAGLAGLVGAGRTELLRALFGVEPALAGEIWVGGEPRRIRSPREAIAAGLGLVPEDRKEQGLFLEMAVRENVSLGAIARDARCGFLDFAAEQRLVQDSIAALRIRPPEAERLAGLLSGGNQQKVVLARWLSLAPQVLLLDEPTRGIDVGARQELYALIDELASRGMAILFASSEMEEVLHLADRVFVLAEGRLSGTLDRPELTEEAVMQLATRSFPRLSA
ncbi:MAG: sugar ABC transporter ATP-binding protein [Planctomycetes bacterium]|nr:sugar ABC transporter ATP-binding protein [Planctomycetota bacterium]